MNSSGKTYICLNGDFLPADRPFMGLPNSALHQGDLIVEELHAYATEPQFLDAHVHKMISAMRHVYMQVPEYFKPDQLNLLISKLLRKNRFFGGAAVRIAVYRSASGQDVLGRNLTGRNSTGGIAHDLSISGRNDVSFVMDSHKLEHGFYELNASGCAIDVFQDLTRYAHPLSFIRNADPFLFLKAEQHCVTNGLDDCVFLNEHKRIVETLQGNIFLVKDKAVFTPSLEEGCIPGVMRDVMINLCSRSGYRMNDQCRLSLEALNEADEIFLADAVNGLKWVGAFRQRRYYRKSTQSLLAALNHMVFAKWINADTH